MRRHWNRAWMLALTLAAMAAAGCSRGEVRVLDRLPPPVFKEPLYDWPASAPDAGRRTDDIEAGWRNHVLPERPWRWIVIHHSGGAGGSAPKFDAFHRDTRGWDELGYHFVVGNGTDSPDGRVEVGSRWIKQKQGAHCATPSRQFNEAGIGVCLVGNFETDGQRPTDAQWSAAVRLLRFLCREYDIPAERILGHRDGQAAEGKVTTECPGKNLDLVNLRRSVSEPAR